MRKTLILGGAGFIGCNLAKDMVSRGERPRIFNRPGLAMQYLKDDLDKLDIFYGDFMDEASLREAMVGVDTVYHLISSTFPGMAVESSVYDVLSNLLPTIRLMEICSAMNVKKIIYVSSGGTVYGEPNSFPITERDVCRPISAFGQSKLAIEEYLSFFSRVKDLDVDILRVSNTYGPYQNPLGIQGIVGVAMGSILFGRPLKVFGQGEAVRDYIYIDDVVSACLLTRDRKGSNNLNISSGDGKSVLEILGIIERVSGEKIEREFGPYRSCDVKVNILSNEKARQDLNWAPEVSLEEGILRTWEWFKKRYKE